MSPMFFSELDANLYPARYGFKKQLPDDSGPSEALIATLIAVALTAGFLLGLLVGRVTA